MIAQWVRSRSGLLHQLIVGRNIAFELLVSRKKKTHPLQWSGNHHHNSPPHFVIVVIIVGAVCLLAGCLFLVNQF